jgi:hypothetical protein
MIMEQADIQTALVVLNGNVRVFWRQEATCVLIFVQRV